MRNIQDWRQIYYGYEVVTSAHSRSYVFDRTHERNVRVRPLGLPTLNHEDGHTSKEQNWGFIYLWTKFGPLVG